MNEFAQVKLTGDPFQRGLQHGQSLKNEISETIRFYCSIFGLANDDVLKKAEYFRELIRSFNTDYDDEIHGIAEGAGVDPLWIVALNSRTEILSYKPGFVGQECTALCFRQSALLGQTWDWGRALEPLTVLMRIEQPGGPGIVMITEPGIIGKIGMNSAGLGVCLNILTSGLKLDGLPIHVLLRAILDCQSIGQVDELLEKHGEGKASNIIVADHEGNALDTEFFGDRMFELERVSGYILHTNHYLVEPINDPRAPEFASSYARYRRATEMLDLADSLNMEAIKAVLSDDSNTEYPIYRDYVEDDSVHELGTVCSIIMSLAEAKMFVRKGKSPHADFIEYAID